MTSIEYELPELKQILQKEFPRSILLVHGNESYEKSGARDALEPLLKGFNVTRLSGFSRMPKLDDIERVIAVIKEKNVDFIIAVGGGTVMDVAKGASLLCKEEGSAKKFVVGEKKVAGKNVTRVLIPTTSGTGAEITPFAVVYVGKTKYSLDHPSVAPEYVILAPELTHNLSQYVTASTGCDALCQAIEGFWAGASNRTAKEYSKQALGLILENLPAAVTKPTPESRRAMMNAAHLAGKSIAIAKTTGAHALSYPLTSFHNIAHGHAVILTLPYFFPINEKAAAGTVQGMTLQEAHENMSELLSLLDVQSGEEAKAKLLALMDEIGLKRKLSDFGISEADIPNLLVNGFDESRMSNNPVKITEEMAREIFVGIL